MVKPGPVADRAVVAAVKRRPGLGVRELVGESGHAGMTVRASLRRLQAAGRIKVVRRDGKHHHYLASNKVPEPPTPKAIAELVAFVAVHPGLRQSEIVSAQVGVPRSTTQFRLRKAVELGFLRRRRTSLLDAVVFD
jgi:predicted transcriptional regulator